MFLCYFRRENSNAFGISPDILTQCDGFIHQNIHEYKDIKKDENVILRIAWQAWPTGQKKRDDATRMSWLSPPDIEVLLLPSSSSRLGVSSPTPLIDDRIDKSRDEKAWDCGTFPFSSWHLLVTPFTEKKKKSKMEEKLEEEKLDMYWNGGKHIKGRDGRGILILSYQDTLRVHVWVTVLGWMWQ